MTKDELNKKRNENPFLQIHDAIYEYLFENIISIDIEPGSVLNLSKMAQDLDVSRTPLQSAVEKLSSQGLVEMRKGCMPIVTPVYAEDAMKICDFRAALEPQAAALAAKLISGRELSLLSETLEKMKAQETANGMILPESDDHFHQIIIDASRNPYYRNAYKIYSKKLIRYRWYLIKYTNCHDQNPNIINNTHTAIYNAIYNHLSSVARDEALFDVHLMTHALRYLPDAGKKD